MKSKKSLMTLVIVTICSFGVVAIANPTTKLFNNFITSVKSVFSTETKTELQQTVVTQNQPKPTPPNIKIKNGTDETVPEQVLWRVIFSFPARMEKGAEEARQKGMNETLWTGFFTRQAKLSEENSQIFAEIAIEHEKQTQTVDEKVQSLMLEIRSKGLQKDVEKRNEIIQLQKQKDEITFRYRDDFKNKISDEAYLVFEKWLKEDFSKGFARKQTSNFNEDEPSYKEEEGQGFKSLTPTKTIENKDMEDIKK